MAEGQPIQRGSRIDDFKQHAAEADAEYKEVRIWRDRIARQYRLLGIDARLENVKKGDQYLEGKAPAKNAQKIYLRYLLPLLEQLHRGTLPNVPTPSTEARTERGDYFADAARELVDISFARASSDVKKTADRLQWDECRWSIAFGKLRWDVEYSEPTIAPLKDKEMLAIEVERAEAEGIDPQNAGIRDEDVDYVHAWVHAETLTGMVEGEPGFDSLQRHYDETVAQLQQIKRERPIFDRVPPNQFVYDTDVPWEERAWEAELRSIKIQDMMNSGWKNLSPENLKLEQKPEELQQVAWEDMTARVWDIHDRRNNKHRVISADGPRDGLFLKKGKWLYGKIEMYIPMVFRPYDARKTEGASTVELAIPILERLAEVDYYIDLHIRTHPNVKLAGPKIADEPEIKAGLNDPNRRFVFAGGPEFWAMVKELNPPAIPDTLLQQRENLLNELRRAVGIDAQDVGAANPQVISATESFRRGEKGDERTNDRQEIMGDFLAQVAEGFLGLYRRFATQGVMVRVLGPEGVMYDSIDPTELPEDLSVFLDVRGETEEGRIERIDSAKLYVEFLQGGALPVDWQEVAEWYGRRLGVRHPEKFRLELPQGEPGGQQTAGSQGAQGEESIKFQPVSPPPEAGVGPHVSAKA